MRLRTTTKAALVAAFALVAGCSGGGGTPRSGPSEAEVRAAVAPYLASAKAEIAGVMFEERHVGVYLRPAPAWALDEYVRQLPLAAEQARSLLTRFPALGDVDICLDAPWLPHPSGVGFVPGTRVQLFRDRASRLPLRFAAPVDVLEAAFDTKSIDFFVDAKIVTGAPAYGGALRELSRRRSGG